jgi:hypothetical protein
MFLLGTPDKPSIPHPFFLENKGKVNSQTTSYFFDKRLNILYRGGVGGTKILCTDAALYALTTSLLLKQFYPHNVLNTWPA